MLGLLLCVALPAWAQLDDGSVISTQGTQFVKPPVQPQPEPTPPPAQPEPAPPPPAAPAAVQAPPSPAPPAQPPPRYPTVLFLLDTSDSMLNKVKGTNHTRLDEAKGALERVIRAMSPETRVQLWVFNTSMQPVVFGAFKPGEFVPMQDPVQRKRFVEMLHRVRTGGGTNLYHSIVESLKFFAAPRDQALYRSGQRFPVLVIISDGEDSGLTRETMQTVQEAKQRMPLVTINTIGFNVAENPAWFEALCRIATHPQGCATAENSDQLRSILESFYRPRES
ncbi:MAG: VWA domain-containing protein [Candidatus Lambdaproteobacteria bacterium]|nr:VWA domain-containing protein [Candidatus Lambdaproteobacteria bacterium]